MNEGKRLKILDFPANRCLGHLLYFSGMEASRWKGVLILLLTGLSLIPFYALYKRLERWWQPRRSGLRFLGWLVTGLLWVGVYSFLLVFFIRLLFPGS